jgi:hypothetical protein
MSKETVHSYPLTFPSRLTQAGILPIRKGPVRFAVGPPNGLTSNSWTLWANRKGDVYISCRDNFKEAKVSLHASGRWRMGFTSAALAKNPNLVPLEGNRAWEVWDQPPPQLPNVTIAFRLYFPTSELAVRPEQRQPDQWRSIARPSSTPVHPMAGLTGTSGLRHGRVKGELGPCVPACVLPYSARHHAPRWRANPVRSPCPGPHGRLPTLRAAEAVRRREASRQYGGQENEAGSRGALNTPFTCPLSGPEVACVCGWPT